MAENQLRINDECNAVAKSFIMDITVRCSECRSYMFNSNDSVKCTNGSCSEYDIRYKLPRIELELK